eukprot:gene35351-42840_t
MNIEFQLREVWASVRVFFIASTDCQQVNLPSGSAAQLLDTSNISYIRDVVCKCEALLIARLESWSEDLLHVLAAAAATPLDFTFTDEDGKVLAVILHDGKRKSDIVASCVGKSGALEALAAACASSSVAARLPRHLAPAPPAPVPSHPTTIHAQCYARVGFMGNPSDNFEGKTMSFTLRNFAAHVFLTPHSHTPGEAADPSITIEDHAVFGDAAQLLRHSAALGYSSGLRVLQAACAVFLRLLSAQQPQALALRGGFTLRYGSSIPRMVGLSGSSALVLATFRALLRHYGVSPAQLLLTRHSLPQVVLDVERTELGISAGLQDRVVQAWGGLVYMDFSPSTPLEQRYTSLPASLLPPLYLVYDAQAGGESGAVHSSVKERWARRDPQLLLLAQQMAANVDDCLQALRTGARAAVGACMDRNFQLRREIYGDAVVGAKNLRIAQLLAQLGWHAKFTGSGGAFVCLHRDEPELSAARLQQMRDELAPQGFRLERIEVGPPEELWD